MGQFDAAPRIALAGRIAVTRNGRHVDERALPGTQARLVLTMLVRERDRAVGRNELADNLWPQSRPTSWKPALRGVVSQVRAFLVDAGLGDTDVVRAAAGAYTVELPANTEVDVERAAADSDTAVRSLRDGEPEVARDLAGRARATLSRPLLPAVDAPWLDDQRRALERSRLQAAEVLAEARLTLGDPDNAAAAAEEAIALDPFREPAYRLLMRAHLLNGDRAGALWTYEHLRGLLARELGVDPSPQTQELHAETLRLEGPVSDAGPPPYITVPDEPDREPKACPYLGLRTFDEGDARYFFGRSGDVTRLLDDLQDTTFLAVLGSSGSGKSSLVRAGLIPALRQGALPASDTWPVAVLRPGSAPVCALADALGDLLPKLDVTSVADRLLHDGEAIRQVVDAAARPQGQHLVLVVDQLEEIFAVCDDDHQRKAFLDALVAAATHAAGQVTVIVTLRADFYPRLADHPRFADLVTSRQRLVTPMDEVGLVEAIEGPARAESLVLESGLAEMILRDVARRPGSLPLLSHCLYELWHHRSGEELSVDTYHEVGGVEGALAQRVESIYLRLSERQRVIAKRILLRLVQPTATGEATRRRVPLTELPSTPAEGDDARAVLDELIDARLLVTGGPPTADHRWVEVAHEALIDAWPRLRGWVENDRAGLRIHRRLTSAAREWERLDRDGDVLFRGAQLAELRSWHRDHPEVANELERAFIEDSEAWEQAERDRLRHRRHKLVFGLVATVIVVSALAVTAIIQRSTAEEQRRVAASRALAAEAVNQLSLDPGLGLALAVEAVDLEPTREAVAALRQALVTPRPVFEVPSGRRDMVVDPAGSYLAVGGDDGTARVWDLASGASTATLDHPGSVMTVEFSPDGGLLATASGDGVRLWDRTDWSLVHHLPHDRDVYGLAWSDDGSQLATAGTEDVVRVWEVASGEPAETFALPEPVSFVRLSPDASTALAWSAISEDVHVIDRASGNLRGALRHDVTAVDARISPDGRHAVTVGFDGAARVWSLDGPEEVGAVEGLANRVWTAEFGPDGEHLIVGDAEGNVRLVRLDDDIMTLVDRPAHTDAVVGAAFASDTGMAATVSIDGTALLWEVDTGQQRAALRLNGAATLGVEARSVAFTPDGRRLITRAASIEVWEIPPPPQLTLRAHTGPVTALELSPDQGRLVTGGSDGAISTWGLATGAEIHRVEVPESTISALAFAPDGTTLVSANPFRSTFAERTTVPTIWDASSGDRAGSIPVPTPTTPPCPRVCQTSGVTYAPDGNVVLTAGQDGVIRLWDLSDSGPPRALPAASNGLRRAVISSDARWVAAAAWRSVPIWDLDSETLVTELDVPGVNVSFGPEGDLLAIAGDDGIATLWDLSSREVVGELRHGSGLLDLAWSSDGRFILTGAGDGAHLWDVATQQQIRSFTKHGGAHAVALTSDDDIVIGGADGAVHVHRCAVCGSLGQLRTDAQRSNIRVLTPVERERYLVDLAG